eukprot:1896179-Amphidinium_carterae.2
MHAQCNVETATSSFQLQHGGLHIAVAKWDLHHFSRSCRNLKSSPPQPQNYGSHFIDGGVNSNINFMDSPTTLNKHWYVF